MRPRSRPPRSADVSEDNAQDAVKSVGEHFAELLRIIDTALAEASRVRDHELVERLERAEAAAEHSNGLVSRLSDILESGPTASDA